MEPPSGVCRFDDQVAGADPSGSFERVYDDERGAPYRIRCVDGGYHTANADLRGFVSGSWDDAVPYPYVGTAGYACDQLVERDLGRHIGMPYPKAPTTGDPHTWQIVDRNDEVVIPPVRLA